MSAFETAEHEAVVQVGGTAVPVEQGRREAIPLNRLFLSKDNARKKRDPASIPALAAMIEAQGLLYDLCVVPEQQDTLARAKPGKGGKRKGRKGGQADPAQAAGGTHGVVAGGRRLAALQWLVQQGRLAEDALIDCLVFDVARGAAVSLTENAAQEPMHPADQLMAFKALVDQGQSAAQIAAAFGVSALTVERRLKLASLAPQFIDLYREGKVQMDVLQALALSNDPAQQVKVWESLEPYNRNAYQIRQLLTDGEVAADTALAVFVGLDAYREAGGAVREDLFAAEGGSFLQDSALLNRLALARLDEEAAKLREAGWKWVEARPSFPYAERSRFAQLHCDKAEPTKKEQTAMDAVLADRDRIRMQMDDLEARTCDEDGDPVRDLTLEEQAEYDALETLWNSLDSQLDAMDGALREWTPEQKALAGMVLCIDREGGLDTYEGLVTAEDARAMQEAAKASGQPGEGEAGENVGAISAATASMPTFDKAPKARAEFSATLCQSLTAHRTAAVAAAFTQSPQAALAALLHTLIVKEREPWQASPLNVRFDSNAHGIGSGAVEYDETPAAQTIAQAEAVFDRLPGDPARLFDHLQGLGLADLLEVLALFVGRAYSVQCGTPVREVRRGFDPAQAIERVLGVDMADWWSPTPERYLRHVSKAKVVEAVTEACGAPAAQTLAKLKKDEAVKAAAALLEGKRWVPSTLRPYATAMEGTVPGEGDGEGAEGGEEEAAGADEAGGQD
jgi:ParB family chromosome partitioning protein